MRAANIGPSTGKKGSSSLGSGKQTLRLRSTGPATVEIVSSSNFLITTAKAVPNLEVSTFRGVQFVLRQSR
jgi:hypothetical protein